MNTHQTLHAPTTQPLSWSAEQALAILAVDNLVVDKEGLRLLKAVDSGELTYDEAIETILQQAAEYVRNQTS